MIQSHLNEVLVHCDIGSGRCGVVVVEEVDFALAVVEAWELRF
jgi:protein tyrosine phosphatase